MEPMAALPAGKSWELRDLKREEDQILDRLRRLLEEHRRRSKEPETEASLRTRAETAEQIADSLRRRLTESEIFGKTMQSEMKQVYVDVGSTSQKNAELEKTNDQLRARVFELEEQARVSGVGTGKGIVLERDVFEIVRDMLGWDFEVERVGSMQARSTDLVLRERRPEHGEEPIVLRIECKHKKELRNDDIDKFLRDIAEQNPEAAIFYSTAPISSTMRSKLLQDERVVIEEEPSADRRVQCVVGSIARALGTGRYLRMIRTKQSELDAKFPKSLRSLLRTHKACATEAYALASNVMKTAESSRKRMRDTIVKSGELERKFVGEMAIPSFLISDKDHDGLMAQLTRNSNSGAKGRDATKPLSFGTPADTSQASRLT